MANNLAGVAAEHGGDEETYCLEQQIGFMLRLANQRHLEIFARNIPDLTPMQFAIMVKLADVGENSQNQLGRLAGMDAATTKGVVDRLTLRGFVGTRPSDTDKRRLLVFLTAAGEAMVANATRRAARVTEQTLTPLSVPERRRLLALLSKLA